MRLRFYKYNLICMLFALSSQLLAKLGMTIPGYGSNLKAWILPPISNNRFCLPKSLQY
jgi:hypothetical protein